MLSQSIEFLLTLIEIQIQYTQKKNQKLIFNNSFSYDFYNFVYEMQTVMQTETKIFHVDHTPELFCTHRNSWTISAESDNHNTNSKREDVLVHL